MTVRVAPSLLACDLGRVAEEVASVVAGGADLLHFDVMDGVFVPNLSFGPALCATVRRLTTLPLDVHLMVTNPDALIEPFAEAGANRLSVHVEAVTHLHRTVTRIREVGLAPGVALNPLTPPAALEECWPYVDFIVIMTVNPGFGGQRFIPEMLDKVRRLAALRSARRPAVELVVDGGVELENATELRSIGVDVLVAGTTVFRAADRRATMAALRGEVRV
ncbi:MAG: ribulose-phosphate 3-epimerase [Thermoanaerobaculaceae bacterium]|nr:ribulose-phosphate 3-epimerase [Thermoanaerobaculaceae bacterium]